MNICVLTHSFPRNEKDVAAAFMKEFCDGLVQAGNKVTVVTPFDPKFDRLGDIFKIIKYKYIFPDSLHILGYSQVMEADIKLKTRAFLLLPFMLFFGTLALLRVVREEKIDVINVHWILPNGLMALIVSKLTGVPFIITLPGTDAYLAHRYPIFGLVARMIAKSSSGVTSNSSWHLNRILDLGVSTKPTQIIPYPVDVSEFKPIKVSKDSKNFIVQAMGRFVYKKGFGYLIRAISIVSKKYPQVKLVLGGDGDLKEKLMNLAKKLKISNKVIFAGIIKRNENLAFYNSADVFVAPSIVDKYGNVDGGPVVSFESMACGVPQIATGILGVSDVIKYGINGFVVPQKDTKAIALAITKLINSKNLREKMGRANRQLAELTFDTKSIGKKYNEFFEKIVG